MSSRAISQGEIVMAGGQPARPLIYGWDGKPLPASALQGSPIDFGPGVPLSPRIGDPDYAPREYQYTPGFNLVVTPRQESGKDYSFAQLRAWADACPLVRVAINLRKSQIRALEWDIVPLEDSKTPSAKKKYQDEIDTCKAFWKEPNPVDGMFFSDWISQALEETDVTDALVFYAQGKRGNASALNALIQINGETIKPVIDAWAHVDAYQQILYGMPATQYSRDELLYWIYNPRVDSVYGTSPIEEMLPVILAATKRLQSELFYYTDGNVPDSFLSAPETWSVEEIKKFQAWLDLTLAGDLKKRSHLLVVPNGGTYTQAKPRLWTKEEGEELGSLIFAWYGIPKHYISQQINRATGDTQQEAAVDTGLKPKLRFFEERFTKINDQRLGCKNVQFKFLVAPSGSDKEKSEAAATRVNAGITTVDEEREEIGKDPMPESEKPQPVAVAPGQAVPPQEQPKAPPEQAPKQPAKADPNAEKAERDAWRRYALKRLGKAARPFVAKSIPAGEAAAIAFGLARAKTRADVLAVFEKAKKRMTAAAKGKARRAIANAASDYLSAIAKRVAFRMREKSIVGGTFRHSAPWEMEKGSDDWSDLSDAFRVEISPTLANVWKGGAQDAADTMRDDTLDLGYYDTNAAQYASERGGTLITEIDQTTREKINDIVMRQITEGTDAADEIEALVDSDARAEMIGRTEVATAQNKGAVATYKTLGVERVHVFDGDSDEACQEANGQVWDIEDADANPIEHPNCERSFSPAVSGDDELD